MNEDRISLIEFLDTQIKDTRIKIKEKRIDKLATAYGQGRLDALEYIKKCLKDSSTLDGAQDNSSPR
jgi:hypothetical protein